MLTRTNKDALPNMGGTIKDFFDKQDITAIDLGCGQGFNTIAISHHVKTIYGIDPSTSMLKFARKLKKTLSYEPGYNNIKSCRFYRGGFINIPIKKVNIIYMYNSLHIILPVYKSSKFNKILDNIVSHIHSGGVLYIKDMLTVQNMAVKPNNIKEVNKSLKRTWELLNAYIKLNSSRISVLRTSVDKQKQIYWMILRVND
jgi:ubiquinone/menaquinone biosynthesis C-methylase UbiE